MWRKVSLEAHHGEPPMRTQSANAVLGSKLYVFGGLGCGASNNFWALDTVLQRWQRLLPTFGAKAPCARSAATLCGDEETGTLYLFGGIGNARRGVDKRREGAPGGALRTRMLVQRETYSDVWEWSASGGWRELTFVQMSPSARRGHTATLVSGALFYELLEGGTGDELARASGDSFESFSDSVVSNNGAVEHASPTAAGLALDETAEQHPADASSVCSQTEDSVAKRTNDARASRFVVLVGGVGPDPKGFENTLGAPVWALDLASSKKWVHLPTSGCCEAAARFEHTTTLVNERLWVVGGLTVPCVEVERDQQLKWGEILCDVVSLDLATLVWTRLALDGPRVALHGHSACENPRAPGEIIVVGGHEPVQRGRQRPRKKSAPHKHDSKPPSPHKRSCGDLESLASCASEDSGNHHAAADESVSLRALRVQAFEYEECGWRALPARGTAPGASYGHICCSWSARRQSLTRLAKERGAELSKLNITVPVPAQQQTPAQQQQANAAASGGSRLPGVSGNALFNAEACVLFFGGARCNVASRAVPRRSSRSGSLRTGSLPDAPDRPVVSEDAVSDAVSAFPRNELYLYDCAWASRDDESHESGALLEERATVTTMPARETASSARSASVGSAQHHHHKAHRAPLASIAAVPGIDVDSEMRFFLDQLELHDGELPLGYEQMKQIVLQKRPDHRTSKCDKGDKPPRLAPWLSSPAPRVLQRPGTAHGAVSQTGGTQRASAADDTARVILRAASAPAGLRQSDLMLEQQGTALPGLLTASTRSRRPATAMSRADMQMHGSKTLKRLPKGTTIWRARDIFQTDVAYATVRAHHQTRSAFQD